MNDVKKFEIWRVNKFNDDILDECVGFVYDISLANDFILFQASQNAESYAIMQDGVRVDINI